MKSCITCWHFPVCQVHEKARRVKMWKNDIRLFFQSEAQSCDWYDDTEKKEAQNGERKERPV